jgi:hypothetical protein
MASPRDRVAKMSRASTTSYGQVIEVSITAHQNKAIAEHILIETS